jgi:hypothetical protein
MVRKENTDRQTLWQSDFHMRGKRLKVYRCPCVYLRNTPLHVWERRTVTLVLTNLSGDMEPLQGLTNYARPSPNIIDTDRLVEKLWMGECNHLAKGILNLRSITKRIIK